MQPIPNSQGAAPDSDVPQSRRTDALVLGSVLVLPAGVLVLATSSGWERLAGVALIAFALFLIAGAYAPRLLRLGSREVSPAVFVAVAYLIGSPELRSLIDAIRRRRARS